MPSKHVSSIMGESVLVQGFRPGPGAVPPYVYLGVEGGDGTLQGVSLSVENANILGEYLRQEAEWATSHRGTLEE